MASISSLEFDSQIVVSRSVGVVLLGDLKKWVIIPLVCIISFDLHIYFVMEFRVKITLESPAFKGKFHFT